jgi:Icc-related predicted phosphoesterase
MKILFASDFHGSSSVWSKWLKACEMHQANLCILSGDLSGKVLVPIVEIGSGKFEISYWGQQFYLDSLAEATAMKKRLSTCGAYGFFSSHENLKHLQLQEDAIKAILSQEITNRLYEWLEELKKETANRKRLYFISSGNDDDFYIDKVVLSFASEWIIPSTDNIVNLNGVQMLNFSYVNPTPWNTPRELPEQLIYERLGELANKLINPNRSIFNLHCPPYNTTLDLAPELNKSMKPKITAGQVHQLHVGSKAIRRFIMECQPMLALHGHIHESSGIDRLGLTLCVNPGSEYSEGIFRGYIIELNDKGIQSYWKVEL